MMCYMYRCSAVGLVTVFMPPIKIDGKAEYQVAEIKGHHEQLSEMQFLTLLIGFDSLEDM